MMREGCLTAIKALLVLIPAVCFGQNGASQVFTRQSGTGAVLRSVESKLRETVSVRDFGAKGDGITDDTASIALAINAACTITDSTLVLDSGTYIIAPVVAANPILPACSDLSITGPGTVKIKPASGGYFSIWGSSGTAMSNVHLSGFTVDMNSANNPFVLSPFYPRIVLHTGTGGTNNTVDHVHVTDVLSEWVFFMASTNSSVTTCLIDNVGGGTVDSDSSLIYFAPTAAGAIVQANTIKGSARNANFAKTAIEVQNTTVVANNRVSDMVSGLNLVGAAAATVSGDIVTGNLFTGVYQGIIPWSSSTEGASGFGLSDALINGNDIQISQSSYAALGGSSCGICFQPNQNLPFRNIVTSDNHVSFEVSTDAAAPVNSSSMGIGYSDATNANSCSVCQFPRNTVVNAPASAYVWAANGSSIGFSGSTAINPGSTLNPSLSGVARTGFFLGNTIPLIGPLDLSGMTISDTNTTSRMNYGFSLAPGSGPNLINIKGGTISCSDATCASVVTSVFSNANASAIVQGVTVNLPSAKVLPTPNVSAQSTLFSVQENIAWTWDGFAWGFIKPHPVAPTAQIGGSTTCGTSRVIAGSDRSGIIVPSGGSVTSCTVTFGTAFASQPAFSFTQLSNPASGTGLSFSGTGSPAFSTGFTVTGTALQGGAITWNTSPNSN